MLNLKGRQVTFTTIEKQYLSGIDISTGESWKIATNDMKAIKNKIKVYLETEQGLRCAYCSSRLYVGGRAEIEHIAPKGKELYPEFTFKELNLVMICQHCNSSSKKGAKDPVSKYSKYYKRCKFIIVHPYFDDPNDHYQWANGVRICIIADSPQAEKSIEIFHLDSLFLTEQRAMDLQREKTKANAQLSAAELDEINRALQLLP